MPMNPRLLRPRARQAGALPPSGTPASLLLRFDGNFNDSSPNALTVTANGDAAISTSIKKYGSGAAYFDGDGDSVTVANSPDFNFDGDFTVEAWIYPTDLTGYRVVVGPYDNTIPWLIQTDNADIRFYLNDGGSVQTAGVTLSLNEWQHIAMTRASGVVRLFVDGVESASETYGATLTTSNNLFIGNSGSGVDPFAGYIDDLRVVKGLAVYTGPFTPPAAPLSPYATTYVPPAVTSPSLWKSEALRPLYHWST